VARVLLALAVLAAGFGGGLALGLASRPSAKTRTIRTTTVELISQGKSAGRAPAPIPTALESGPDPHRIPLASAIPPDANLVSAAYVTRAPEQLVVTWDRQHLTHGGLAIWQRKGVAVWQLNPRSHGRWRRVYTYETLVNNVVGVEGYGVELGDISGDGRPEVLIVFDTDGSAGGAVYHLLANDGYRLREPLVESLSEDEGTMDFAGGALVVRRGVDFRGPGIHCCFRKVRVTWLRWTGRRLVVVRRELRRNRRGWPPGEIRWRHGSRASTRAAGLRAGANRARARAARSCRHR
jgi:hypothetical protein